METIPASLFKWNDGFGVANCSELGLKGCCVDSINIKSDRTGNVLKFELDLQEAIDNESWDGELRILRSPDKKLAVKIWNY